MMLLMLLMFLMLMLLIGVMFMRMMGEVPRSAIVVLTVATTFDIAGLLPKQYKALVFLLNDSCKIGHI